MSPDISCNLTLSKVVDTSRAFWFVEFLCESKLCKDSFARSMLPSSRSHIICRRITIMEALLASLTLRCDESGSFIPNSDRASVYLLCMYISDAVFHMMAYARDF